jgi:tetratricopeptide (TPR) repeat protein
MRKILIFLLLLCSATSFAQSDAIINTTTLYIAQGQFDDAEKYLDSLMHLDPNSIDAMMMKGNVMLNRAVMQTPPLDNISIDDESIYSKDLAALQTPVVLVPHTEALKIEKLWKRCIALDSGRLDIREGLCTMYGMADMKNELIGYVPVLARAGRIKGDDFVFALVQYAQLLSERNDKEGSYEVYKKIAGVYPSMPGIWCLLAEAYHDDGNLDNAKLYVDKALTAASMSDIAMCSDALDIYTAEGEYVKELSALKIASQDSLFKDYPFYNGIYEYANHNKRWRKELESYLHQFPAAPDSNAIYNTATFMLSKYFTEDYDGFISLLKFSVSDLFIGLVAERAMHDYKDSMQPYLIATQVMMHDRNYAKANTVFATLENKITDGDTKIDYQIQYAFSLYCAGDYAKAIGHWSALNKTPIPFLFATSNYFLGASYLKSGNKEKAKTYFQTLVASSDQTKYAYLAKIQLDKLGSK